MSNTLSLAVTLGSDILLLDCLYKVKSENFKSANSDIVRIFASGFTSIANLSTFSGFSLVLYRCCKS